MRKSEKRKLIVHLDESLKQPEAYYYGFRFPPIVIGYAVWLHFVCFLSLRDVERLLAERGVAVSYESIRKWCNRFGSKYTRKFSRREVYLGDTWYLDEVFTKIRGELVYLWRAVDKDDGTIDILIQKRRSKLAARRFFPGRLKMQ